MTHAYEIGLPEERWAGQQGTRPWTTVGERTSSLLAGAAHRNPSSRLSPSWASPFFSFQPSSLDASRQNPDARFCA